MWFGALPISDSNFKQPSFRVLAAQSVRGLPVPREPREGVERREAPGHQRAPLEAGLTYPPRAARLPRAPSDVGRSASRRSTLATSLSAGRCRRPARTAHIYIVLGCFTCQQENCHHNVIVVFGGPRRTATSARGHPSRRSARLLRVRPKKRPMKLGLAVWFVMPGLVAGITS
jgi:hypothetical protein